MKTKLCSLCKAEKAISHFHSNVAMSDGLHFYCKDCHSQTVKNRRELSRERLMLARNVEQFIVDLTQTLKAKGWSVNFFAKKACLKNSTIYDWIKGRKLPSASSQHLVCEMLNIPYDTVAFATDSEGRYPDGMGSCDCGKKFPTYNKSFSKYCSIECKNVAQSTRQFGERNPMYKDGRKVTDQGYIQLLIGKGNPMANKGGYALEHRYVMSKHLGRTLRQDEVVHHINGDRTDNRLENLELCQIYSKEDRHPPGQRLVDKVMDMLSSLQQHELLLVQKALEDKLHELYIQSS